VGQQRPRDASDLLPPRPARREQGRPPVRGRPAPTSSAEWADSWLGLDVGSDIALANAIGREIIAAGLEDERFIGHATEGFEAYGPASSPTRSSYAERETGVPGRGHP
jgi:anaerobic selenocysteine-containing dehydrogenase